MANSKHLAILKRGVATWNAWRRSYKGRPDLRKADFSEANLIGADLRGTDLREAMLYRANLIEANLRNADLREANLVWAALWGGADLRNAELSGADLSNAELSEANLSGANLRGANLRRATLVNTNLRNANLSGCQIFGISAWKVHLEGAIQNNLIVTPYDEPTITVDNLEVAQFIYLLLNNQKIRDVIDTITSKVILILGRFKPRKRKAVLDAIREELRKRDYLPVVFDFDKPSSRDFTETVLTLAGMARFVIADITDPRSIPQELTAIVHHLAVPVQPILLVTQKPFSMFSDFKKFPWVLPTYHYANHEALLADFEKNVIAPPVAKAEELKPK